MKLQYPIDKVRGRSKEWPILYLLVFIEITSGVSAVFCFMKEGVDLTGFVAWISATGAAGVATTLYVIMQHWNKSNTGFIMKEERSLPHSTTLEIMDQLHLDPEMVRAILEQQSSMKSADMQYTDMDLDSDIPPVLPSTAQSAASLKIKKEEEKAKKRRRNAERSTAPSLF